MKGESKRLKNESMIINTAELNLLTLQNRLFVCDAHLEMMALSADRHMALRHLKIALIGKWCLTLTTGAFNRDSI